MPNPDPPDFDEINALEDQLIEQVRRGESNALARYIDLKRPQLLAFIERNLSDALKRKVEADDIFQEVSIHCVKSIDAVDFADHDPFSWLCQVAERRIIDSHRKYFATQKRDAHREVAINAPAGSENDTPMVDLLVASLTSPSAVFSRDQREIRLHHAVAQLPEDQRQAIKLRFVDGLATKEIAEQLGKSDAAIRVLLSRVLKKLQTTFEDPPSR